MRLHEDRQLFEDAINSASLQEKDGGLGINPIFIEKDYWICRSLKLMSENDKEKRAVFKGGTSLSKAYGIGFRFSEDVDIAIAEAWTLSGNQLKNLIRNTAHNMTKGLEEIVIPGKTSKGSHYHKAYYRYPQVVGAIASTPVNPGQVLVEINSFANPYPFEDREIQSFLTTYLYNKGEIDLIKEYEMQPFTVPVLDKRRTLTEKLVSLMRCSLADDYIPQLIAKIRHFYDLYYLFHDEDTKVYIESEVFKKDFNDLLQHDKEQFSKPEGWQKRGLDESPLVLSLDEVWARLESTYLSELPELAYDAIPDSNDIVENLRKILKYI